MDFAARWKKSLHMQRYICDIYSVLQEMFIQHFITQAYVHSKNKKCINYGDIAVAVENEENLHFLSGKH